MSDYFDALETRDPAVREAALLAALPAQIAAAQRTAAFAEILRGVDAAAVDSRGALARLPVTRKHELLERQKAQRRSDPFGGFSAIGWRALGSARTARRVFQSPGPIYEPEGPAGDYWRFGRALFAAGFRAGDLVHNSFSYHLTPAGSMMETGAHAIGCTVFPGGVGQHRAAAAGDGRTARRRLCRHAELPAHRAGEGRRTGPGAAAAAQGLGRRRGLSRRRCATRCARVASRPTRATAPPTSA